MPELPEVEVVRQSLDKRIKQKKVKKVLIRNRNLRFRIPSNFEGLLKNQRIIKVDRFSKYLILCLSNNSFCLLHLGMSGTIHIISNKKKNTITNSSFYGYQNLPKKHNHVEIFFDSLKIVYNDPRRFGFFQFINNPKKLKKKFIHLGPEPFDLKFNINYISSFLKGKKKNVKNILLDQKFVAGIGNIYASEILFLSRINPNKKVYLMSKKEFKKIIKISRKVLLNAIKKGGSTIKNFVNISGNTGSFQNDFKVYDREGLNCKKLGCNGIIKKKNISNRSTYFCDLCQK